MQFTYVGLIAMLGALVSIAAVLNLGIAKGFLDQPNRANAMHSNPTPRIGWIGVALGATFALAIFQRTTMPTAVAASVMFLLIVSAIDDRRSIAPVWRLLAHVVAAAVVTVVVFSHMPSWLPAGTTLYAQSHLSTALVASCTCVLLMVWSTNLYNFMDGANGLTGFMTVLGFGALSFLAQDKVAEGAIAVTIAPFCAAIAGAGAGFLLFNFPKARVFLGDAGSIPLGFLASVVSIYGAIHNVWLWWAPVVIFSPFIVDATVTLLKRCLKRERIWEAHRQHYYHRLILTLGWSHTKTALAYAALMLACASWSIWAVHETQAGALLSPSNDAGFQPIHSHLLGWVVTYVLLLSLLEWRFYKRKQEEQNKNKC
jgi:UDP-GlcNAc:undecaprenyl-phosphate/decaprenyl-phosphate GlcNAc-1-phosphate transferase